MNAPLRAPTLPVSEVIALMKKAQGIRRTPGVMNGTESAYAAFLKMRQSCGEVLWFDFECWTFKLADGLTYLPDFPVMEKDGTITLYDTKGRCKSKTGQVGPLIKEASMNKLKMCARLFPMFRWVITWPLAGGLAWGTREL